MSLRVTVLVISFLLLLAPVEPLVRVILMVPFWLATLERPQDGTETHGLATPAVRDRAAALVPPLLLLWFLLLVIALVRGVLAGSMTVAEAVEQLAMWGSVAVFLSAWVHPWAPPSAGKRLVAGALGGIVALVTVNVLLYAAGVTSEAAKIRMAGTQATVLGLLGLRVDRAAFPLGSGLNAFSSLSAAGFVAASVMLFRWKVNRRARAGLIAATGLCAFAMLAADNRSAMAMAPGIALAAILLPAWLLRRSRWLVPLVPFMPAMLILGTLAFAPTANALGLSRAPLDVATAGKRLWIWLAMARDYATFRPVHLVGYGYFGQTTSGLVHEFSSVVGAGFDESRTSAANGLYQWILDTGYIGGLLYLTIAWLVLKQAARHFSTDAAMGRLLTGVLVYLLMTGTTEPVPTPYSRESFFLYLCFAAAAVGGWWPSRALLKPQGTPASTEHIADGLTTEGAVR